MALARSSSLPTRSGSGAVELRAVRSFVDFSFRKNETMLGFEIDPFHLLPRGSRRMTDDSIQIAAASPSQRRAHGTMRASVGDETIGDVAFRLGRTPRRPRCDRRGNFPPCKALKSHKMRKESRSGPVPAPPSRRRLPPSRSSISRTEECGRRDRGARNGTTESPANGAATP